MIESGIWREAYQNDPAIIYALDKELRLVRCNPAWDRFACDNGAPELASSSVLGTSIMDVIPNVLRDFYVNAYSAVRKFRRPWWHTFDCSSRDVFRTFHMRALPAGAGGILVVNTLIVEEPHQEEPHQKEEPRPPGSPEPIEQYTDANGVVTMCANCRRAEHLTQPGRWDWIPLLLASSGALVRPGLCPFCFAYHYPARDRDKR